MSLPTLTDLKIHQNITTSADDDELADTLDAAVEVVAGMIGPLETSEVTETHRAVSGSTLLLRRLPAGEVTAVSGRPTGFGSFSDLTLADYEVDVSAGVLRMADGGYFYGDYTVTYTSGRESLPASIRLAVLIIAAHLFETQRRPGFTSDAPAGFGGVDGVPDASIPGRGYAIPSRAQELLQPYMRPVIA
ncbi:hypothetical protein [Nocardioides sp.]|uniref:hypothetical protein n=1 Tax=Nocardioides sp. TaxID=35761 RepID=UPI00356B33EA